MAEWVDGEYPTDAALDRIKAWPFDDMPGCFAFVREIWHWPDWAQGDLTKAEREVIGYSDDEVIVRLATGGWSGNESIVSALRANIGARLCWRLSAWGGLHVYAYRTKP